MKIFNCELTNISNSFRKFGLVPIFFYAILLQSAVSFADTPLGLSPLFKCVGSAAQSVCTNGYTYSTGSVDISQFQFIGYVFPSQVSGTVPVYHAVQCQTDPVGRCYPLGSSPQDVFVNTAPVSTRSLHVYSSELLGYVYPTQA
ncbi:MAG TPA: hypothetical protein VHL14_12340, partial [Steroidobacteraceae bacterium]|nr:hypothetical protein [Steroidobacteraceae bacterium]